MQKDQIRISNPEAAKTLRDSPVLHHFLEPASPSEVAKKVGMPANLVHHHAKRALELGILFEAKKQGRKIFYQLAAKNFTHRRDLLTLEQTKGAELQQLSQAFLEAYLHCETDATNAANPDYHMVGFADPAPNPPSTAPQDPMHQHPAHFHVRTLMLGVAQYQKLLQTLHGLLEEAEFDQTAQPCTIAVLGFTGEWRKGHNNCTSISSFALEPSAI
jgi:DNA-binding transcriptional ArsR family regulator